ncbi:hypothetical protein H3V11_08880 [Snodgrassella sp. W8158]|uniref:hypothetical protein n=1 Tax=Snodgrassella sp. W8158 TaxID=2751018 RepID=UPI0018DC06FD|nr:hypothetical protein [Snodgrassella sp. W8158]MBI0182051.1 hypothetical protein [Snodgrassella sp. W8158]
MAKDNQQDKSDQVEQIETSDNVEELEQTETSDQNPNKQNTTKQKPPKESPAMETKKVVSKLPEAVKVRVTRGYNLLHPYTNKHVTTELREFPCDNWLLAQLQAGFVDMYTVTNERLLWTNGKLVYEK